MKIYRATSQIPTVLKKSVVTIGNFDGVHRGHQSLIQSLKNYATQQQCPAWVVCFEPQPAEFFQGQQCPARITNFREKMVAFKEYGVEQVLCLSFDTTMSQQEPEEFIRDILQQKIQAEHLVLGGDFQFGRRRRGDIALLEAAGFSVKTIPTLEHESTRISSTRVRQALANNDFHTVEQLLARVYTLQGRVVKGDQRGRTLGFPTINLLLHRRHSPLRGVFAVRVHGVSSSPVCGAANIGVRPMFDGEHELLEVHLFDFSQEVYGRYVTVEFIQHLRAEKTFPSIDALCQQMTYDCSAARAVLSAKHFL